MKYTAILAGFILGALPAAPAKTVEMTDEEAPAPLVTVTETASLYSSYVWKGQLTLDKPVFQHDTTIEFGALPGFYLSLWSNWGFGDNSADEHDLTLGYDFTLLEEINVELSLAYFNVRPHRDLGDEDAIDLGVKISYEVCPFATVFVAADAIWSMETGFDGFIVETGVEHEFEESRIAWSASVIFDGGVFETSAATTLKVSLAKSFELPDGWTLTPEISGYATVSGGEDRDQETFGVIGVSLTKTF
jgi:hypothetical protein